MESYSFGLDDSCLILCQDKAGKGNLLSFDKEGGFRGEKCLWEFSPVLNVSWLKEDQLMFSGYNKDKRNSCVIFSTSNGRYEVLPYMNCEYSIASFIEFDRRIYVLGKEGSGNNTGFECYDIEIREWRILERPGIVVRIDNFFIYDNELYIIGWFNDDTTSPFQTQKYSNKSNKWEIVDIDLNLQYEKDDKVKRTHCDTKVFPSEQPNKIFLVDKVIIFKRQRREICFYIRRIDILNKELLEIDCIRVPAEAKEDMIIKIKDEIKIIWKDVKNDVYMSSCSTKKYPLEDSIWKEVDFENGVVILGNRSIEQDLTLFKDYTDKDHTNKNILFASNEEPSQIEIDYETGEIQTVPIPLGLNLNKSYNTVRISNEEIFFFSDKDTPFIYKLDQRTIERLPTLNLKGNMYSCIFNIKNTVYVVSYELYGCSFQSKNLIHHFDLKERVWRKMSVPCPLTVNKHYFTYQNRLYAVGGSDRKEKASNLVEVYNNIRNRWEILSDTLSTPMSNISMIKARESLYYYDWEECSNNQAELYQFNIKKDHEKKKEVFSSKISVKQGYRCLQVPLMHGILFCYGNMFRSWNINSMSLNQFLNNKQTKDQLCLSSITTSLKSVLNKKNILFSVPSNRNSI